MKLHSPIANTTLLKLALFIFLFASYTSIFAQNKCKTKVSYFASRNPEKLALKLTSHLNDDAEKVEAIHCWITHHIKYDVKKSGNYDYSRKSAETILKKRKAICMGYTDLFNELCKHAGIISTEVPGYTKGLHTDLNDHFYIDEHIWNAVYINNEWKYIDNTWDAGYVINHKRSIWGAFVYFFSGGKYDRFKIKPRFKFRPVLDYYLKDANSFNYDHFPANPLWQFASPQLSLKEFEADSSFFLRKKTTLVKLIDNPNANEERLAFITKPESEKFVEDGKSIYNFNKRNPYTLATGELLTAFELLEKLNRPDKTKLPEQKAKEIIYANLKSAKIHYDSSIYQLGLQKEELKYNNRRKHEILGFQNKYLIASARRIEKKMETMPKTVLKVKLDLKLVNKKNKTRFKDFIKSKKVYNTIRTKQFILSDSNDAAIKITHYTDSIKIINGLMFNQFAYLDSLYEQYNHHFAYYGYVNSKNIKGIKYINNLRLNFEDDLDFFVRSNKDSIIHYKKSSDSLLFGKDKVFILNNYIKEAKKLKSLFTRLYSAHKGLEANYAKLVKYGTNRDQAIASDFRNKDNFRTELNQYLTELITVYNHIQFLNQYCKKLKHHTEYERKLYEMEKSIESKCYAARSSDINLKYNVLSKNCKIGIQDCTKIKEKTKKE